MEELIGFVLWLVIDCVLMSTGRVIVRLISRGAWRGEEQGGNEARVHGPAGALSFRINGHRVFTRMGLGVVGLVFYAALVVGCIVWP